MILNKIIFITILILSSIVYAYGDDKKKNITRYEVYDLSTIDIDGELLDPDDLINKVKDLKLYKNDQKIRKNFKNEIINEARSIL